MGNVSAMQMTPVLGANHSLTRSARQAQPKPSIDISILDGDVLYWKKVLTTTPELLAMRTHFAFSSRLVVDCPEKSYGLFRVEKKSGIFRVEKNLAASNNQRALPT